MARVKAASGDAITQALALTVEYSVELIDASNARQATPVTGHTAVDVALVDCIHDTMQTGEPWSKDSEGCNLKHSPDVSTLPAFELFGRRYRVTYTITTVLSEVIVVVFEVFTG